MKPGGRWALLAHLLLAGCAGTPQSDRLLGDSQTRFSAPVELQEVVFFPQEKYQCGPAALATVLTASGIETTPDQLVDDVYVPGRQGSLAVEMVATARRHGRIAYPLPGTLESLLEQIGAGRPVLVFQNLGLSWYPQWHYAVVVGYDPGAAQLLLRSGKIERYAVKLRTFERTWARADHWAQILLVPGEVPEGADASVYFQALVDFERSGSDAAVEAAYQAGLERWPDNRWLGMGVANLQYRQGNLTRARATLLDVVRKHPDFASAHNNLAQVLSELGEGAEALAHARRAVALGGAETEQFRQTLETIETGFGR